MPGKVDGLELALAVRFQYPDIKIVLTSSESLSTSHRDTYDGFVPKPYDARRLIERVKALLR
jgi:DNA-binding response OmpR family regulator